MPTERTGSRRRKTQEPIPPGKFNVRMDNSDQLFEAMQKGISGGLGRKLLEDPVREVTANVDSKLEDFNLTAEIDLSYGWRDSIRAAERRREAYLQPVFSQYPDVKERGGLYVITTDQGNNFVIGQGRGIGEEVSITTGLVVERYGEGDLQITPAPKLVRASFDTVMTDFGTLLVRVVNQVYEVTGKSSPDEELVLGTPRPMREGRERGLFDGTPESLIGKIEVERPDVSFDDIGGQSAAKREIEGLTFALKNPDLYAKWGTRPPKGILLYGPPGTGKTLLARALASQAKAKFFHVKAADIGSKYYGESEQIVKGIFDYASNTNEKTILFFDEIDSIAPPRAGAHEATQKVMATLLDSMDGLVARENIVVVASTNRRDSVEPALLRAGRFDRWVEVPLPDEEGRKQTFEIHIRKAEAIAGRKLFNSIRVDELVAQTNKSSGADIAEVLRRSLEEKVRLEGTTGQEPGVVTTEDIAREVKLYEKTD